jgi:hypothetical protein
MTILLVEETLSEEEQLTQIASPTVKCSWCGEIIRLEGQELALAMCNACYDRMLAEYERALKTQRVNSPSSDR